MRALSSAPGPRVNPRRLSSPDSMENWHLGAAREWQRHGSQAPLPTGDDKSLERPRKTALLAPCDASMVCGQVLLVEQRPRRQRTARHDESDLKGDASCAAHPTRPPHVA